MDESEASNDAWMRRTDELMRQIEGDFRGQIHPVEDAVGPVDVGEHFRVGTRVGCTGRDGLPAGFDISRPPTVPLDFDHRAQFRDHRQKRWVQLFGRFLEVHFVV